MHISPWLLYHVVLFSPLSFMILLQTALSGFPWGHVNATCNVYGSFLSLIFLLAITFVYNIEHGDNRRHNRVLPQITDFTFHIIIKFDYKNLIKIARLVTCPAHWTGGWDCSALRARLQWLRHFCSQIMFSVWACLQTIWESWKNLKPKH